MLENKAATDEQESYDLAQEFGDDAVNGPEWNQLFQAGMETLKVGSESHDPRSGGILSQLMR